MTDTTILSFSSQKLQLEACGRGHGVWIVRVQCMQYLTIFWPQKKYWPHYAHWPTQAAIKSIPMPSKPTIAAHVSLGWFTLLLPKPLVHFLVSVDVIVDFEMVARLAPTCQLYCDPVVHRPVPQNPDATNTRHVFAGVSVKCETQRDGIRSLFHDDLRSPTPASRLSFLGGCCRDKTI